MTPCLSSCGIFLFSTSLKWYITTQLVLLVHDLSNEKHFTYDYEVYIAVNGHPQVLICVVMIDTDYYQQFLPHDSVASVAFEAL